MSAFTVRSIPLQLVFAIAIGLAAPTASAQDSSKDHDHDGHHGQGHAQWHDSFYQKLLIPGTKSSCCNLSDCRPTQIRTNGDHYEIMKDGRWIRVDPGKIVKTEAPDGGAHICAPDLGPTTRDPDLVYCIVMPSEM
jgi:hypothetical protein